MDAACWSLPGPARFLTNIVDDLRSGLNVLVTSPAVCSISERVLESHIRAYESLHFICIDADECATPISESLHRRFGVPVTPGQLATAAHLAEHISARNVIFVMGVDSSTVTHWIDFLSQYQHGCNGRPPHSRSVFCVPLPASYGVALKRDAVLAVRRFEAEFWRIDGVLQMERLLGPSEAPSIERELMISMGAEVAGCDIGLSHAIAEVGTAFLTSPFDLLLSYSRRKQWSETELQEGGLDSGVEELFDGVRRWHSSALALRQAEDELSRRFWHGQIRALFPFIEEERISLAATVEPFLRLPVNTHYGPVARAVDLELSEMIFFLRGKRLPPLVWDALQCLRQMRNELAHRRPVALTPEDLRFFKGHFSRSLGVQ
jgi:hypothetical protein